MYEIEDLLHEKILGAFYGLELQKTTQKPTDDFLIKNIIESKKKDGVVMKKVQWLGYEAKFDKWIPESELALNGKQQNKKNPHPIGHAKMFHYWLPSTKHIQI